ncbi:MAG: hypothetical protein WAU24_04605 [Chitinophagaceae bacterium]
MKKNFKIISTIILLLAISFTTFACDCILHPVEKYIDTSDYIITAKVEKLLYSDGDKINEAHKAILLVTRIYKGGIKKSELIEFDADNSNCSFKFQLNKEYLLFCCKAGEKFFVYHCSYSDEVKYARKNIKKVKKFLRQKMKPGST